MGLLERVATLVRANLNDLIDRAEDPEKMMKQVVLDMQNQLLQVKTQVAMAMADRLLLARKLQENEDAEREWLRKAETAVAKGQDDLARPAVQRSLTYRTMAAGFRQQLSDQDAQVERLKSALTTLEGKLIEAQAKSEMLIVQQRRARSLNKATDARTAISGGSGQGVFERMRDKVQHQEALSQAKADLAGEDLGERLLALEREDEIDQVLREMKERQRRRIDVSFLDQIEAPKDKGEL